MDLTPGTGYAITTITKYLLMLIGGLVGFSMIGIEWSKLQWLVAALGVGLGFGLQEIFANFISGLIILFEKPIRIGDTVTIRDLTGSVTIFELRIYAAEMGHRMPLRHEIHQLILAGFHAHGIDMPFPPFQMRLESLNGKQTGRTLTSAGKGRQAGSL